MSIRNVIAAAAVAAISLLPGAASAQDDGRPTLHVYPRWKECSFRLDPSLTQRAWRQFTEEAGLVVYFRPLSDARPMGKGNYEVSMLQWKTGIDDADAAWNDTFVHPDSTHWLFEGSGLAFPGLMLRAGVGARTDVGAYVTKAFGANYGFWGAQLQRAIRGGMSDDWGAAARVSFVAMYGPEDLNFAVWGADLLASRRVPLARWAAVSPYLGVSTYYSKAHETTDAVSLHDERVLGAQGTIGAALHLARARLGAEYNVATVPTFSLKLGVGM